MYIILILYLISTDIKQIPNLSFLPRVVANSDFPASQVSVHEHRKHFKIRHRIQKLRVESKESQGRDHKQ